LLLFTSCSATLLVIFRSASVEDSSRADIWESLLGSALCQVTSATAESSASCSATQPTGTSHETGFSSPYKTGSGRGARPQFHGQ
jgi:hypothetical protein